MKQYKVCVYAICKNESKFAERWFRSMSEADEVIVLDTGSTDDTADKLRALGAAVVCEAITPWRFDTARNRSLALVPEDADICVCTDLDEVFEPGWREKLEAVWADDVSLASYRYTWNFNPDGSEGYVFWIEKAHSRHGFRWTHPVHEVLQWVDNSPKGKTVSAEGVRLYHHADPAKSRAQYLPLLELSVAEDPTDDRNMHYLGREYLFCRRWDDCIKTLRRHLALPTAVWQDERAASMRYIARAYQNKGDRGQALCWYLRAAAEAPHLREPYLDLASLLYETEEWEGVLYFTACALRITHRPRSYISEAGSWGSLPYDLRAIAFFKTGRNHEALAEAELALQKAPHDPRLQENVAILKRLCEENG